VVRQLLGEACFSDAGLATDKDRTSLALKHPIPRGLQSSELMSAPDERRAEIGVLGDDLLRRYGFQVLRVDPLLDLPQERLSLGERLNAEFVVEELFTLPVLPQRGVSVAAGVVEIHQLPVDLLLQGIDRDQLFGVLDRLFILLPLRMRGDEILQGLEVAILEMVAFL